MLQRAASNAFSGWWASHIRTKQSIWLEQSLIDMEEKVNSALNIIQRDGDSFGKRAELYFRHRPDLVCFVEETFRAYRSLGERYDKLSRDLQKANTTIASICPDQVSYEDFDDDDVPPKITRNMPPPNQGPNSAKIPKVPPLPNKNLKGLISNASKKMQISKAFKDDKPITTRVFPKSGLSKEEALEEIDKIQKEILTMQTMKEFTKSSYENGLSKYWEIDNKINTMQQRVCRLQDEFKVETVMDDADARTVMAQAALKSCKETLDKLEEKRDNSSDAAKAEHEKIVDAKQKINALKRKLLPDQVNESKNEGGESRVSNQDSEKEAMDKVKESLEELSKKQLTVTQLADTTDKLANKVISLESTVLSQTANIDKLRNQAGELQTQIQNLESDTMADESQMRRKLKIMVRKLEGLEDLEKDVEKQNSNLKVYFTESRCRIEHLSEKLHDVQPDDEAEAGSSASEEEYFRDNEDEDDDDYDDDDDDDYDDVYSYDDEDRDNDPEEDVVGESEIHCTRDDDHGVKNASISKNHNNMIHQDVMYSNTTKEKGGMHDDGVRNIDIKEGDRAKKEERNDHINDEVMKNKDNKTGTRDNEKEIVKEVKEARDNEKEIVKEVKEANVDESHNNPKLKQYTTTLRNYKETKKKLSEKEKEKLGTLFELIVQVRELKTGIAKRDNEIQLLKQKLNQPQGEEILQQVKQDDHNISSLEEKEDEEINISIDAEPVSEIEERFRTEIDAILDENLDFWLRFSTQFQQVQKFKTEVEDLKKEMLKVKSKAKRVEAKSNEDKTDGQSMFTTDLKSDIRPICKHLKEVQGELRLWLDEARNLKQELEARRASLSNIQEEITMALKEGMLEEKIKFSTHHAAKFQGEILNMEQENNRVNEELQAGIQHTKALHVEIKKTLRKLDKEFGLSENQNAKQETNSVETPTARAGIPLRSFIFGVKEKKQKPSIFNVINNHKKPKVSRP